eukprot:1914159-Alexandrium_andersonii.AAC.1
MGPLASGRALLRRGALRWPPALPRSRRISAGHVLAQPSLATALLAVLLDVVEETARWPEALLYWRMVFLPTE